ncbi:MAG: DegT/DnrJ/EryC1/StrS family aminotransferase [Paludibacteraceae bacterium]|nr:DegT/DnrJ/EryC1/StrS family aminotransferase [Paludibacteraceae bacterium]
MNGYRNVQLTYSSREGLNVIYRKLYEKRGALRVAVSPLTCFIAIYPMVANGHVPVFVDIDSESLNMDEQKLVKRTDVDAVQVIHMGGNPMRMDKVMEWAKKNSVVVIEDCAQALGATYQGKNVGSFGDFAVASAVKNVHGVCGGLLIGDCAINQGDCKNVSPAIMIYKRIKRWLEMRANAKSIGLWNALYGGLLRLKDTQENGFNNVVHRLSEKVEREIWERLEQLDVINAVRKEKAEQLIAQIDRTQFAIQQEPEGGISTRNRVMLVSLQREAREVIAAMRKRGIAANNLTQSYTHPYQEHVQNDAMLSKYYTERLEVYERILPKVVCVPCSPALSDKEIDYIAKELNTV